MKDGLIFFYSATVSKSLLIVWGTLPKTGRAPDREPTRAAYHLVACDPAIFPRQQLYACLARRVDSASKLCNSTLVGFFYFFALVIHHRLAQPKIKKSPSEMAKDGKATCSLSRQIVERYNYRTIAIRRGDWLSQNACLEGVGKIATVDEWTAGETCTSQRRSHLDAIPPPRGARHLRAVLVGIAPRVHQ